MDLRRPTTAAELLERLPEMAPLPLPCDAEARWLLLALYRHLSRQAWVGEVVESKLQGNREEIGLWGAFEHPEDVPQVGPVPGLRAWSYEFHGVGCCLTHEDGTKIDVDFVDGGTSWIDPWFYEKYLASLPEPAFVERRLVRPKPFSGYWMADLPALSSAGLLKDDHRVCLTEEGRALAMLLADAVGVLESEQNPWSQAWMALVFGDPVLAVELLDERCPEVLRARAAIHRRARAEAMSDLSGSNSRQRLMALADLGRGHAESVVMAQLEREPVDGLVSTALQITDSWSDPVHADVLVALAVRTRGVQVPRGWIRVRAAATALRLLGKHGLGSHRARLIEALSEPAGAADGVAGLLLSLLDPERGLARLSAGLESSTPVVRAESAAALGLLGTPSTLASLRRSSTVEAKAVVDVLRGLQVEPGPEPEGTWIEWRGQPRRVFCGDEILRAAAPDLTTRTLRGLTDTFEPLVRMWLGP